MVVISWPTVYLETISSLLVGVCVTVVARLTLQRRRGICPTVDGTAGETERSRR